jgi:F-type H+-transporting ATPase subunit c
MKKTLAIALLALAALVILAPLASAEEAATAAAGAGFNKIFYYALAVLGCGFGIGLAALGTGIGMGSGLGGACEGVARNPGVSGKIMTTMIVGMAMIESLCIYALVVVLIVLYANPFHI